MARATAIIGLSNYTRDHILRVAGRRSNVHVVYGAGNYATAETAQHQPDDACTLQRFGVDRQYILYVGDFNRRKNIPYLIESFAHFKRTGAGADFQLLLAGNSATARQALEAVLRSVGLKMSDVVFTGRVTDAQLAALYRHASAFALCSLGEGFTLVTLEAMSYGVPVVATDTSSIAEGTGNAAELVPLDDPRAVASALVTATSSGARRDEMRRIGKARLDQFTWRRNALQTLDVYRWAQQRAAEAEATADRR
jgi:glycosyltransferase involved in cell wall biosynthesis